MQIEIDHKTEYRYSDRVFLEPHVIRLMPRTARGQRVVGRELIVDPPPSGITEILDENGSNACVLWFKGMTTGLKVHSRVTVLAKEFNPYDFLIYPTSGQRLPLHYSVHEIRVLAPYLKPLTADTAVSKWARSLAEKVGGATVAFLSALCDFVYKEFRYQERLEGPPHAPELTLKERVGCCRDFVLFAMAACRAMNLATRFVSGYYYSDRPEENRHTHAWMEVYIPGGGWRGFDPTHGIACYNRHITISASSEPEMTMPVVGHFRGFANARMHVNLQLRQLQNV